MTTELSLCLQAQKYIQSLPSMPPQDLEKIFRGANPLGGCCLRSLHWISLGSDLLSCPPPTSVSLSCRPPQAHAGAGLRWEDLRQRGPGPPLLLAVPRPGGRARCPALRPDPGEQRPNSGGVERQDSRCLELQLSVR